MADLYSYLLLLFFFFAFHLSLSSLSVCDGLKVDGKKTRGLYAFKVGSLAPATTCSSPKGFNRNGLKVVHRHGPCSPLRRGRATNRQILRQDQARVDLIHTRVSRTSQPVDQASATLPANRGSSFGTGNYIVTVGLGTPKKDMTVEFDTGSDLTWVQCKPCTKCYPQKEPIFDPTQSSTYQSISCDSSECVQLVTPTGNPTSCVSSTCGYTIGYGDGSSSSGVFGKEMLTLTASDAVLNFNFGCAQNSDGLFNGTAGLLGLGRDPVSLVSQSAQKFGQVFSYCLPSSSSTPGYLTFGSKNTGSDVKFTPLLKNSRLSSFYFLAMEGINVGGKDVGVPASTFSSPGTIIDSGTVITRLHPAAYSALRDAFKAAMSNYTLSQPPDKLLDTCYDFSGLDTVTVPTVELRFQGGVVVDMDITGIFYVVSQSQFCLAFAGNDNAGKIGIIGNVQQRTIEVVYDLVGEKVGFGAGGCS